MAEEINPSRPSEAYKTPENTSLATDRESISGLDSIQSGSTNISPPCAETTLAGDALRKSELAYRTLVETSHDLIWSVDTEGRWKFLNSAARQIYGFEPSEMLGRPFSDFQAPDQAKKDLEMFTRIKAGQRCFNYETEHRHKNGARIWLSFNAVAVFDENGRVVGTTGTAQDVTARKFAEDSFRLGSAALEAAANGIFITDLQGVIRWVNPGFTGISGYSAAEAIGQKPSLVKSDAHDEAFYRDLWNTVISGQVWRGEITNRRKNGKLYISEQTIAPVKNAAGEMTHFVSVQQDVTDRKNAEDELRWKTAFFEAQVDSALDGILVVDGKGNKILQNRRMDDLWKIPESISSAADDSAQLRFVTEQVRSPVQFAEKVAYLYAHPDEVSRDEIEKVDGTILERYSSPVRDKAGKNYGRIWTFRDITERRKMEQQLRQSQKMESVGQLAGGVAHDFNNILAAIFMQTELALGTENLPDNVRQGLRTILAAAQKAASLARQLLQFGRRNVMEPTELDLNKVVTNLSQMLGRIIGEDVRLRLHLHSGPLTTLADAGMLDQVLLNLAVNARDAMPDGGTLLIETDLATIDQEQARLNPDSAPGRYVTLSVSDTGCGIAPEVMSRIFEPFFTTKEIGKGTGLGLAIVFGIVKQHRGWIKVYSEPGLGTNFRIFLPAGDVDVRSSSVAAAPAQSPRGTETILLVEDETAVRMSTRSILERAGYQVLEAANGQEALKLWPRVRTKVALLLTDIVMPGGVTGKQLARRLRDDQPGLKVIYCSGYSVEMAGPDLGLSDTRNFIQKPFTSEQLLVTLRKALDHSPAASS